MFQTWVGVVSDRVSSCYVCEKPVCALFVSSSFFNLLNNSGFLLFLPSVDNSLCADEDDDSYILSLFSASLRGTKDRKIKLLLEDEKRE